MTCCICDSKLVPAFTAIVLGRHKATYAHCRSCGFLCAQQPNWLEDAYSSAISSLDTGLVWRNIVVSQKLSAVLFFLFGERGNGRYLDIAGGCGMLTRLMRDNGFDFFWADRYSGNLLACGFEYISEMGACRAVTAIEVLEHTEDPIKFIRDALELGQTDTLIFTTELFEGDPPLPDQWPYYLFEAGQHIAFFQQKTLAAIADRLGLRLASAAGLHVLTKQKVNSLILHLCTSRLGAMSIRLIQEKLGSRTVSDRDLILERFCRKKI